MNRRSFFRMLTGALAAIPIVRKFAHCEVPKPTHYWFPKSAQVWENGELISAPPKPTPIPMGYALYVTPDGEKNPRYMGMASGFHITYSEDKMRCWPHAVVEVPENTAAFYEKISGKIVLNSPEDFRIMMGKYSLDSKDPNHRISTF